MVETRARPRKLKAQDAPPDILSSLQATLEAQAWVVAKTMPQDPHEYTLKASWVDPQAFETVVRLMRLHGYHEVYRGRIAKGVLNAGRFKYWTMGPGAVLINRRPLP